MTSPTLLSDRLVEQQRVQQQTMTKSTVDWHTCHVGYIRHRKTVHTWSQPMWRDFRTTTKHKGTSVDVFNHFINCQNVIYLEMFYNSFGLQLRWLTIYLYSTLELRPTAKYIYYIQSIILGLMKLFNNSFINDCWLSTFLRWNSLISTFNVVLPQACTH